MKKYALKNKSKDSWSSFMFNEIKQNETKPEGTGWMTREEMCKKYNLKKCSVQKITNQTHMRKDCVLFAGTAQSNKGRLSRCVWYRLIKGNWDTYFINKIYTKKLERKPLQKDWYTVWELRDKTGLSPIKIRKLISVNKMSNRIKMFDGYAMEPSSGKLKRRIWYKLCLNGLKT